MGRYSALQVQQLTAARTVCGWGCLYWSKKRLLTKVGWLSIRQLIYYQTVLQAHKTIQSGKPRPMFESISTSHPRNTRNAVKGLIRYDDHFKSQSTFKYRACQWYNAVPATARQGSLAVVKRKLKAWVGEHVPIDCG